MVTETVDVPAAVKKALAKEALSAAVMKFAYKEARNGDQGFTLYAISYLSQKLENHEALSDRDNLFLRHVLYMISRSNQALNIVSGASSKRGRSSDGLKGIQIAQDVKIEVTVQRITYEEAWHRVAERRNLSASMVKRHWMRWKDALGKTKKDAAKEFDKQLKTLLADGPDKG